MRVILAFLLLIWLPRGIACTVVLPHYVTFDKALSQSGEQPPDMPRVTVEAVTRGRESDSRHPCPSPGVLVLSIPVTPESRQLAYSFEMISGSASGFLFRHGPNEGVEENGKLWFRLPGLEGVSTRHGPLNLVIRITPFRRSGLAGKPTDIKVVDGAR
jgi:hypothetical protein